jgi:hypothetical protein
MISPRGDDLASVPQEKLILSLPPDPALARLTRLATLHFLRQNGVKALDARRKARAVEQRSKTLLRTAARAKKPSKALFDFVLTRRAKNLEVILRRGTSRKASLLQVKR